MIGNYRPLCSLEHDMSDYRDPEPPPLPPTKPFKLKNQQQDEIMIGEECVPESLINLKSRTSLFSLLNPLGNLTVTKVPTNKNDVREKQKYLLNQLPEPEERELLQLKMLPYDYLLMELHEDGFLKSEERLKRFMGLDDAIREYLAPEPYEITRMTLRNNKSLLKIVSEVLKQVEFYNEKKLKEKEFTLLVHAAYYFNKIDETLTWLSYELYLLAAEAAKNYINDEGYGYTLINYLMGKLLFKEVKRTEEAIHAFWIAHRTSMGQEWTADCITGNEDEIIHKNTCCLLYESLFEYANHIFAQNPDESIKLAKKALHVAREINDKATTTNAILNLSMFLMKNKQSDKAVGYLTGLINKSDRTYTQDDLCNSYLLLALCFKNLGHHKEAYEYLTTLMNYSMQMSKDLMFGVANRYIGEYYLYHENFTKAMMHLDISYGVFLQYNMFEDIDIVGFLYGVARSYRHKALYLDTLVDDENQDRFNRIINWKMDSTPFWDYDEDGEERSREVQKMKRKERPPELLRNKPILPPIPKLMRSIEEKSAVIFQAKLVQVQPLPIK